MCLIGMVCIFRRFALYAFVALLLTPLAVASDELGGSLSSYSFIPYKTGEMSSGPGSGSGGSGEEENKEPPPYDGDIELGADSETPYLLPPAELNVAYDFHLKDLLSATDTTHPSPDLSNATWEIADGSFLPAGLLLDKLTGRINGIPFVKTIEHFEVIATHNGKQATKTFTLEVKGALLRGTMVDTGPYDLTCAITVAGGAKCWGVNHAGQLGDGTKSFKGHPVDVYNLTPVSTTVTHISSGYQFTCATTVDERAYCWGSDFKLRLGDGKNGATDRTIPTIVMNSEGAIEISAGVAHGCLLKSTGDQLCWGENGSGELGVSRNTPYSSDMRNPIASPSLSGFKFKRFGAGNAYSCGLTTAGGVKCFGSNSFAQLGNNIVPNPSIDAVDVFGLTSGIADISVGGLYACALTGGGAVKCWGDNRRGQLGDGTTVFTRVPVNVEGLPPFGIIQVSAGTDHTCVITAEGGVKCWGANAWGQLGNGTTTDSLVPVDVIGLSSGVTQISVGARRTCAVMDDNLIKCWGYQAESNSDGSLKDSSVPVDVALE